MKWPESIHEGLPPPRDDEPAQLHSDIVDEIADHLGCAMTHERRRTDDDTAARRNVLARFGNPAAIARRLWLDAMKEKIMTQRITLAAVVVLTLAGITASTIAWRSVQEGRQVNQAMLAKLEQMSTAPAQAPVPSSLSTISVRLLSGSLQGDPIVGESVRLSGKPFSDEAQNSLSAQTDKFGKAIFGPMNPGKYTFYLHAPFGYSRKTSVTLYGGQEVEKDFVIPLESQLPGPEVDISFKVLQPAGVEMDRIIFLCTFDPELLTIQNTTWYRSGGRSTFLTSQGMVLPTEKNFGVSGRPGRVGNRGVSSGVFPKMNDEFTTEISTSLYAGIYKCRSIQAYYPLTKSQAGPSARPRGDSMVYTRSPTKHFEYQGFSYPQDSGPRYEANVGEKNVWEIEIPEPLVEQLREVIAKADEK